MYVNLGGHQFLYSLVRFIIYLFTLFVYLSKHFIIIFSPKRRYILCKRKYFFNDWNISETWTRNKLLSLKTTATSRIFLWKKNHFWRESSYFFSRQLLGKWKNRVIEQGQNSLTFNPYFLGKHIQHFTWSHDKKTKQNRSENKNK